MTTFCDNDLVVIILKDVNEVKREKWGYSGISKSFGPGYLSTTPLNFSYFPHFSSLLSQPLPCLPLSHPQKKIYSSSFLLKSATKPSRQATGFFLLSPSSFFFSVQLSRRVLLHGTEPARARLAVNE